MKQFSLGDLTSNAFVLGDRIPASHLIWDKIQENFLLKSKLSVIEGAQREKYSEISMRSADFYKNERQNLTTKIKNIENIENIDEINTEETSITKQEKSDNTRSVNVIPYNFSLVKLIKKLIIEYQGAIISQRDFLTRIKEIRNAPNMSISPLDRHFPLIEENTWRCFKAFCFYPGISSKFLQVLYLFPKPEDLEKDISDIKLIQYKPIRDDSKRPWQLHLNYAPRPRLLNPNVKSELKQIELAKLDAQNRKSVFKALR